MPNIADRRPITNGRKQAPRVSPDNCHRAQVQLKDARTAAVKTELSSIDVAKLWTKRGIRRQSVMQFI